MKHIIITFIICLLSTSFMPVEAQGYHTFSSTGSAPPTLFIKSVWDATLKDPATAKLNALEKEAVYYINVARMYPRQYADSIVLPYLKQYPKLRPTYGESLVNTLQTMDAAPMMLANLQLNQIAILHARDLSRQNNISHTGSDGRSAADRLQAAGFGCGSECVHMSSFGNAAEMVLSLLIDYGVRDLGHRKALLNPGNKGVGVGVVDKNALYFMVVNMSCD